MIDNSKIQALFTPDYVSGVFQKATESSFVMKNATRLRNMTGKTMELNVLSELPVAYWTDYDTEHRKLTELALKGVTIYAKEAAVIVPISKIALADADTDVESIIRERVAEAIAKLVDEAVILGKNKPRGFREGIIPSAIACGATVTQSGTLYAAINDAMGKVEESDYEVTDVIGGLGSKKAFRNMLDSTGQPIAGTEIDSLPKTFLKNGVWDKNLATLLLGDMKEVYYSIRQEMEVEVLDQATIRDPNHVDENGHPITYDLAQQRMIAIMATIRLGWEIPNPISVENAENANAFPFAVVQPSGATNVLSKTLTITVKDGATAKANVAVYVGGNKYTTNASGQVTANVTPNTTYMVDVWADGYYAQTLEAPVANAAATLAVALKAYPKYAGLKHETSAA